MKRKSKKNTKKIKYGLEEFRMDLEKEFQKTTFGKFLVGYRIDEQMSQKELANILGTTPGAICHLEKGRKIPSAKRACEMTSILGMDELLCVQLALQDLLREQKLNFKVFIAA